MMPCSVQSLLARTGSNSPPPVISAENDPPAAKGVGPRIYVGGIPNALSQTMIKNHFNHYGKVVDVYFPKHPVTSQRQAFCFVTFSTRKAANAAVSQSNRKINGHQVSSIASTADRPAHHRFGQQATSPPHQATVPVDIQPQQPGLYGMCPEHTGVTALQPPSAAASVWPAPSSPPAPLQQWQGLPDVTDLHSLLGGPAGLQHLLISHNQAALALLLAASSQSNAPLSAANLPTWDPAVMPPPPTSAVAPAYLQAAVLADAAARSNPALHAEPSMLSQPSMTCYEASFGRTHLADEISATAHMLQSAGLQNWPQMMETASNPPVHNYSNNIFPNLYELQQAEQPACETDLRFGPQNHSSTRDMRLNRHSPY